MIHQPFKHFYILETDKDPSLKIMEEYVLGEDDVLLLKPIISRPPVTLSGKIYVPELEKMLVDIYCDQDHFFMFGGQEMIYIFENAIRQYNINYTSIYAYAERRGKKELLKKYIEEKVNGL